MELPNAIVAVTPVVITIFAGKPSPNDWWNLVAMLR